MMKKSLYVVIALLLASLIAACSSDKTDKVEPPKGEPTTAWWLDAVFYQIWPRSFKDTDGDGIGDFKGITSQLDYLVDLGITAIWLTPMFEAPSYHGYDFQEFYQVESDYGTMEDFQELLDEAEKRGIKVIADLVLNHISKNNEWFIKSAQKQEPYSDYFIWQTDIPQGPWGKPWATPEKPEAGYNKPEWVWIYNDVRQEYYYAVFDGSQPDINLTNKNVVTEMYKLTKFWADKGFDGFRLDAIRYAIEEGPYPLQADNESTIQFWIDYNNYVKKQVGSDIMLVGEVWAATDIVSKYYQNGNGIDTCFDFNFGTEVMAALNSTSIQQGDFGDSGEATGTSLLTAMIENFKVKANGNAPVGFYSPFLTNHDQNRIMYQLGNDPAKMKIAAVLLLTNIGAPYIYYGEEIGMTQNQEGDDIFKRAPMQWDTSNLAGFTTGDNVWVDDGKWVPWREDHQPWWKPEWENEANRIARSVEGQKADQNSLFNLYKTLIKIRKENPEFRSNSNNSVQFIEDNPAVCAYKRTIGPEQTSYVLINSSLSESQTMMLVEQKGKRMRDLITGKSIDIDTGAISLEPAQYVILKLL